MANGISVNLLNPQYNTLILLLETFAGNSEIKFLENFKYFSCVKSWKMSGKAWSLLPVTSLC